MSGRRLKKRVIWYTWAEFGQAPGGQRTLDELVKLGYAEAGRIEITDFTDGSCEVRYPVRRGRTRSVQVVEIPAEPKP